MTNQITSNTTDNVNIVLITDENFVIPTATAIYSIIQNKLEDTKVSFHIVFSDLDESKTHPFIEMGASREDVEVNILPVSAAKYDNYHVFKEDAICVASIAALLKFDIPYLLPNLDKVLYLDGDIIVRGDLQELYNTDIKDYYAATVIDSGSIYLKHEYTQKVSNYFNSGVMLLNLKKLRENNVPALLAETKKSSNDSFLMDQNIFNVVFDGKTLLLPIRYNCLYVNLLRAKGKYSIVELNEVYATNYSSLDDIMNDALIIHYSSADKPWKTLDVPLVYLWKKYCSDAIYDFPSLCGIQTDIDKCEKASPAVSVIIPVYNTEEYLEDALNSILEQTLHDIEVICVNDGSTDGSASILERIARQDSRIRVLSQVNCGQSAARNLGLKYSRGKYIYFFDSDDLLAENALEELYKQAERDRLDLLLFDGDSFFESEELEQKYSYYKTVYSRNITYSGIQKGTNMFINMRYNSDYTVQPCLFLLRREYLEKDNLKFLNGICYEDNLFSLQVLLQCNRVGHKNSVYFHRRLRENSTVTSVQTLFHFHSHFKCLLSMWLYIMRGNFSSETNRVAKNMLLLFQKTTFSYFKGLPFNQRSTLCYETKNEQILGEVIFAEFLSKLNMKKALKKDIEMLRKVKKSRSYRIGRFFTFIPRKARAVIRRLKKFF